jgi:hypothetical protein
MKILHTSDWHIGRSLYGRKRYDEFSAFLGWLAEFIQTEREKYRGTCLHSSLLSRMKIPLFFDLSGICT